MININGNINITLKDGLEREFIKSLPQDIGLTPSDGQLYFASVVKAL